MITALAVTLGLNWPGLSTALTSRPEFFTGSATVVFAKTALATTLVTSIVWIAVTFLTRPEREAVLVAFYRKVRPQITGWAPIAALAPEIAPTRDLGRNLFCWILGTTMVYSALFGVGKLLLHRWALGGVLVALTIVCVWEMSRQLSRGWSESSSQP